MDKEFGKIENISITLGSSKSRIKHFIDLLLKLEIGQSFVIATTDSIYSNYRLSISIVQYCTGRGFATRIGRVK